MKRVTVIFTCFNRKEKTRRCIKSLVEGNPQLSFEFVILDDNSTDGTFELLNGMKQEGLEVTVMRGGRQFLLGRRYAQSDRLGEGADRHPLLSVGE